MDELVGRSVLEDANDLDGTSHTIDPSRDIFFAPCVVSSAFKKNGTVATSSQPRVSDDLTTSLSSSPPQKKLKHKSATRRGSNAELSTFVKQATISGRAARASFVSVPDTSLRSATSISPRMSARLAKKIHPFILTKSRDIYPYLASKDSLDLAESLREDHSGTGSSRPSASILKKKKGPPRNINLADDAAKAALMEEWANIRMSQGTLLLSTSASRDTTPHLSSNRGSKESCNEAEILSGEVVEPNEPHSIPANDHIEHPYPRPSGSLSNQVDEPLSDSVMPATNESLFTPPLPQAEVLAPHNSLSDDDLRYPSSSPENVHPAIEDMAPSQYVNEGTTETIAQASCTPVVGSLEVVNQPLRLLATDSEIMTLHPASSPMLPKLDILLETTISASPQAAAPVKPEDSSARASPSAVDIQLVVSSQTDIEDVVLGFHMLDLHEVLSPWVPASPAAPSIYVPPAVQHLIAAMNRQLEIECKARKRAEELYIDEMRKRIKMEEVVDRLQRERGQTREQGASQQPPSLHVSSRAASAHSSQEEAGQQDDEANPTSMDTTYPNVTKEGSCT
ncbi:hypothetical protein EV702DRAFT_1055598 [Suillus placidus]|uniref:Uncharacterized protein n=1 Tax=Suillus placidus TaxID=48579 RepID=A0A9P7A9A2_9AGAM|nr:hypothetical protein EV702DRAFT_1055598 [Suillus placidus]